MHKSNWDDLRFVLAVADTGSVSQAARQLGVNHATVLRRVSDFETRHSTTIFEKTTRGYRVLADKRDVIKAARQAESAISAVGQLASGHSGDLQGRSRVTSTDTFSQIVLPDLVAKIQAQSNGLFFEIVSSNAHIDLARHRIDVAIRPTIELPEELEGEMAAQLGLAVYAIGPDVQGWLGLSGPLSRSMAAHWMSDNVNAQEIVGAADSFFVLRELAATGCGRAILPCIIGDADVRLRRMGADTPYFKVPVWVANHIDPTSPKRVRLLRTAFVDALREISGALLGQPIGR